jgi:hypothetical protein
MLNLFGMSAFSLWCCCCCSCCWSRCCSASPHLSLFLVSQLVIGVSPTDCILHSSAVRLQGARPNVANCIPPPQIPQDSLLGANPEHLLRPSSGLWLSNCSISRSLFPGIPGSCAKTSRGGTTFKRPSSFGMRHCRYAHLFLR